MVLRNSSYSCSYSYCYLIFVCILDGLLLLPQKQYLLAMADSPAFFIFGDSTVDVGANNNLPEGPKANFPYNGIDFPQSIYTGRFCNGFNIADQIVRRLGLERSPPAYLSIFQDPSYPQIVVKGVNFASGGSGILQQTGSGKVVTMGEQIQQFMNVRSNLTDILGEEAAADLVTQSLFLISVGGNDILDFYTFNRTTVPKPVFLDNLQQNYRYRLAILWGLGARKFGVIGVPPIGCCPSARLLNLSTGGSGGCYTELNEYAQEFQSRTADMLEQMSSSVPGALRYSLGNAFDFTMNLLADPASVGITNTDTACCGLGTLNAEKGCFVGFNPNLCPNRKDYFFWDFIHATEYVYGLAADTFTGGEPPLVTPINFAQLAQT